MMRSLLLLGLAAFQANAADAGVDGGIDAGAVIYVSTAGDDAAAGTLEKPVRSIAKGISLAVKAGGGSVRVSEGEFTGAVTLPSGVSLTGGFAVNFGSQSWLSNTELTSKKTTQITYPHATWITAGDAGLIDRTISAESLTTVAMLDNVVVVGPDLSSRAGQSSFCVVARGAGTLRLRGVKLIAGTGGNGAPEKTKGADGAEGNASAGGVGGAAHYDNDLYPYTRGDAGSPGESIRVDGKIVAHGGYGGVPGADCGETVGTVQDPRTLQDVVYGTCPGAVITKAAGVWTMQLPGGGAGEEGDRGVHGLAGKAHPDREGVWSVDSRQLLTWNLAAGAKGGPGGKGAGGGGGGAGASRYVDWSAAHWTRGYVYGGTGGTGGFGGFPGEGGGPGLPAGGSFGLAIRDATVVVEGAGLSVLMGSGGNGGAGGAGGEGKRGAGPTEGVASKDDYYRELYQRAGKGGSGGPGGIGGFGGGGSGGNGGPSIGIALTAKATLTEKGRTFIAPREGGGRGGVGGQGGLAGTTVHGEEGQAGLTAERHVWK